MNIFERMFRRNPPENRILRLQKLGLQQGWFFGPVNGEESEVWKKAIISFKRRHGLRPRYLIGPVTEDYIRNGPPQKVSRPALKEPKFMKLARAFLGLKEIKGRMHNPEILNWWKQIGAGWFTDDETPYCGAFVGAMVHRAGYAVIPKGGGARARAYAESPDQFRKIDKPCLGCVVVFWRGSKDGRNGHVGFLAGFDQSGRPMVLGANQKDTVTIAPFDKERLLGYYLPVSFEGDQIKPPVLDGSTLKSSRNEA